MAKLCFGTWAKEHQNAGLVAAWVGEMIESKTLVQGGLLLVISGLITPLTLL